MGHTPKKKMKLYEKYEKIQYQGKAKKNTPKNNVQPKEKCTGKEIKRTHSICILLWKRGIIE